MIVFEKWPIIENGYTLHGTAERRNNCNKIRWMIWFFQSKMTKKIFDEIPIYRHENFNLDLESIVFQDASGFRGIWGLFSKIRYPKSVIFSSNYKTMKTSYLWDFWGQCWENSARMMHPGSLKYRETVTFCTIFKWQN